jgi:hypothetical protein
MSRLPGSAGICHEDLSARISRLSSSSYSKGRRLRRAVRLRVGARGQRPRRGYRPHSGRGPQSHGKPRNHEQPLERCQTRLPLQAYVVWAVFTFESDMSSVAMSDNTLLVRRKRPMRCTSTKEESAELRSKESASIPASLRVFPRWSHKDVRLTRPGRPEARK